MSASATQGGRKPVTSLISIALIMSRSSLDRSGRARVNKGLRSLICHPYVHTKWNKPAFIPGPQNVTSLWLVRIFRPTEGRRLSWPGWLGEIPRWFIRPKTVTHPRGCGKSNSRPLSRKCDALTRRQSHYSTGNIIVHNLLFKFAALLQIEKLEKLKYSLELMQGPEYYLRLFNSVYSVVIYALYIEILTDGKVTNWQNRPM